MSIPPHSLEAEAALLGAAMLSTDALEVLVASTAPADYWRPAHRHLAELLARAQREGWNPEPVTLWELIREEHLEHEVDREVLVDLVASCPSTSSAPRYAQIIRGHALRRALLELADELIDGAYALEDPITAAEHARTRLAELVPQEVTTWAET